MPMEDNTGVEPQDNIINNQSSLADFPDPVESGGIGWGWRAAIVAGALVVIAFLVYPWLQQGLKAPGEANPASAQLETSIIAPDATVQATPDSADAQFELGNAYVQAGQLEQALAAYQRVIELDPDYQAAYANMGVVYYQLQQLDLAALQYKKALELKPDDAEVAYNLGALYLQQALLNGSQPDPDLLNQAIAQLKEAMELNPRLAEPHFSLGVAYNLLNQTEDAIQAFETFLKLDTGQDHRARQEAQRYLQTLRGQ